MNHPTQDSTSHLNAQVKTLKHLVLLGDSIFDNAIYVPNGPAVIHHLRALLPAEWQATLVARDGDVVTDIGGQITKIPIDATHLVLSIGGNDALESQDILLKPAGNVESALTQLAALRRSFRDRYRYMLGQLCRLQMPLAVCTIYDAVPELAPELETALCLFNDTIVREANTAGLPIIDLRCICTNPLDYSEVSPIEPSGQGGSKIAAALMGWACRA